MRSTLVYVAFIVLVGGCGSPKAPEPAQPSTSATAPTEPPAAEAAASGNKNKKRTRTSVAKPPPQDGTKPKNGRALNPKDATGRTVFVRADDQCFVEVPPKGSTEVVDCPEAANDPAFDHCTAQIVLEEGSSPEKCYCVNGAIVPRPMPNPTPCPKH